MYACLTIYVNHTSVEGRIIKYERLFFTLIFLLLIAVFYDEKVKFL